MYNRGVLIQASPVKVLRLFLGQNGGSVLHLILKLADLVPLKSDEDAY